MNIINCIKLVADFCSSIIVILTLVTLLFKPVRTKVKSWFVQKEKNTELQNKTCVLILRNNIITIYYKHFNDKQIPIYERQVLNEQYELYSDGFNENHYIEEIYSEMKTWETIK